jgi:Tol biopolymer transport system component
MKNHIIMGKLILIILAVFINGNAMAQDLKKGKLFLEENGKKNAYPRWSKDGKSILYQTNRNGKWQLEIVEFETKKTTQLLKDTFNNNFPDWSKDNKWVAFVSDRDGNNEIYIVRTDGSGLKRLTTNKARDIHPYFSPDGKYLLFNSDRNGSLDIFRINLSNEKLEQLTNYPSHETCARYSPDMKQMIFLKNDDKTDDIFSYDFETKTLTNITKTPGSVDGWPMYSADGKWIFFSSLESGLYCIYKIRTDGTEKQMISKPTQKEEDARVCVSPDGKKIVYNKDTESTISIYYSELN